MNAKLKKRGETYPAFPDSPPGAGLRAKILPQWMYRDPVEVVERVEASELQARDRRERMLQLEREEAVKRAQHAMRACIATMVRVVVAPPEVRLKRARIQALTRNAMKGLK